MNLRTKLNVFKFTSLGDSGSSMVTGGLDEKKIRYTTHLSRTYFNK